MAQLIVVTKQIELVIQQLRLAKYQLDVRISCLHVHMCEHVGNSCCDVCKKSMQKKGIPVEILHMCLLAKLPTVP